MSNAKQNMTGKIIYIHDDIVDIKFYGYIPSSNETIDILLANGHTERAKVVVTVRNVCRVKTTNAKDLIIGQECVATGKTIIEEKDMDDEDDTTIITIKCVIENMRNQVDSLNKSIDSLENILRRKSSKVEKEFTMGMFRKMGAERGFEHAKPFPSFGTTYAEKIDDDNPTLNLNLGPDTTKDETGNN